MEKISRISEAELNEVKIGKLACGTLWYLLEESKLSSQEIEWLCLIEYCKDNFNVNFPILKKFDSSRSNLEDRRVNGYYRYYSFTITSENGNYLITNDWYERSKKSYISWLRKFDVIN